MNNENSSYGCAPGAVVYGVKADWLPPPGIFVVLDTDGWKVFGINEVGFVCIVGELYSKVSDILSIKGADAVAICNGSSCRNESDKCEVPFKGIPDGLVLDNVNDESWAVVSSTWVLKQKHL